MSSESVVLMPQNACNQRCRFCRFQSGDEPPWSDFDRTEALPYDVMLRLLDDLDALKVQHVEITGGGEPLAYPWTQRFWERLVFSDFSVDLSTNGTLLKGRAEMLSHARLRNVRVSIDAATPETYSRIHRVPEHYFGRAWMAVREFRKHASADPEFCLTASMVICEENRHEEAAFREMARENGAHAEVLMLDASDAILSGRGGCVIDGTGDVRFFGAEPIGNLRMPGESMIHLWHNSGARA